ncbi:MAG: CHAD domain-containing protein [Tepidisphaeraceae bacterium]
MNWGDRSENAWANSATPTCWTSTFAASSRPTARPRVGCASASASRARALEKSRRKIDPEELAGELTAWTDARVELATAAPGLMAGVREATHARLDEFVSTAHALLHPRAGHRVDVHELRIAGKGLRYTLEMARCGGAELSAEVSTHFKQIQDDLGLWHDWVVLAMRALQTSVQEELALHDADLQRAVARLVEQAMTQSDARLDAFKKHWKRYGASIEAAIRSALPVTRPVASI